MLPNIPLRPFLCGLLTLLVCSTAWADSGTSPAFTLNGKPVPDVVATVNGKPVPAQFLENQVVTRRLQYKQMGQTLPPEEEEKVARETLKHLVDQELLYQKREELGLKVDPKRVDKEIKRIVSEFPSEKLFRRALKAQRLDMDLLRNSIEKRILEDEFIRRQIAPKVKVTPEMVRKYYEEHRAEFKKPKRYKIQHIYIAALHPNPPAEDAPEEVKKKAERLRKLVDADARKTVNMVYEKLEQGESFEELARQHSEDHNSKDKGGLLGEVIPSTVFPQMAEWLPKLKPGEYSKPIQTPLGYHILKLAEILPESTIPLKEVETEILNHLLRLKVQEAREAFLKDLRKSAEIKLFI